MKLDDVGSAATESKLVNKRLLMVEDTQSLAITYQAYLRSSPYDVEWVDNLSDARLSLEVETADLVLLDLELPDGNGLELLREIKSKVGETQVVVMSAYGSSDIAEESVRQGAFDYITKPFNANRLLVTLKNAETNLDLSQKVSAFRSTERSEYCGFIGSSIVMQMLYRTIDHLAPSSAAVFILGESGTGKELAAKAIHQKSNRSDERISSLNCMASPAGLMESELFGNVNGVNDAPMSDTGSDREGIIKALDGGTLFLDEICDIDLALQNKLLKFIQTGTYQKVGSSQLERADTRILCATSRDPLEEVRAGRFSEDLYCRLNIAPIQVPPLRDRDEDVLLIAQAFLENYSSRESKLFVRFSDSVKMILRNYTWPGNVRELNDCIRDIVVLNSGTIVTEGMVPGAVKEVGFPSSVVETANMQSTDLYAAESDFSQVEPLWQVEKNTIQNAISICDGNIIKAASLLEVAPSTIYRKLQTWSEQ